MDTLQVLLELKLREKYTIVHFAKNGYLNRVHFHLRGTCLYKPGIVLLIMKPTNAPVRNIFIDPNSQFIIWQDFLEPDWSMMVSSFIKDTALGAMRYGRSWSRFDLRYIKRAMDSVSVKPIVWNIKELKPEQLHDTCHVLD